MAASCRARFEQPGQADQVVSGDGEGEGPADPLAPFEAGLTLAGDGLDPAEALLDPLADPLADTVAGWRVVRKRQLTLALS